MCHTYQSVHLCQILCEAFYNILFHLTLKDTLKGRPWSYLNLRKLRHSTSLNSLPQITQLVSNRVCDQPYILLYLVQLSVLWITGTSSKQRSLPLFREYVLLCLGQMHMQRVVSVICGSNKWRLRGLALDLMAGMKLLGRI